jgi:hypothetical protein
MEETPRGERETTFEIEHGHDAYTDEELLEQSQFNAQALLLASVVALGGDRATVDAWSRGVADVFIRGWDQDRTWQASEILDALLTNYRSFGAQVIDVDLQMVPPVALIADLPDLELASDLGVDEQHADAIFLIGTHIVRALGHELAWERDASTGDVHLTIT